MADPELERLRQEIKAQLQERDASMGAGDAAFGSRGIAYAPGDPREMRPKEPGDPGPTLKQPVDPMRRVDLNAPLPPEVESQPNLPENPGVGDSETIKRNVRASLNAVSGGATNAVSDAVAGAGGQAAGEVEANTLETKTPEQLAELMVKAGLIPPEQQQAAYAVIKPHWQPGTRTSAEGATGKDPNAVRSAMELQGVSEKAQATGLQQTQEADRRQYEMLQQVQQNEMNAVKAFKNEHDALQSRYEGERQAQMERMGAIQKAMDAVPDAPRTIREKMDRSGFTDKASLGLAAAFSVLGGATLRDGGRSVQTFLGNVQANIDRDVQKEADEYARLGERAKMSNNIYAHMRQGMQDDVAAMNLTKALYYDAAANAVQQIATQYKMDTQAPQIQSLLAHLAEQRQKLVLDTAQNLQTQFSQTDKFNPGGVVQVGGSAAKKNEYKSTDLEKDTQKFSKELDERGFNMGERAMSLYQKAINKMRSSGFKNDEAFKTAFVALSDPHASPTKQIAVQALLNDDQRAALSLIVEANKEGLKDSSGKSVTANELVRDVLSKGDYSVDSLDRARQAIAANREQIYKGVARGYDPRIWEISDARGDLAGIQRKHAGIGTAPRQPVDVKDIAAKVEGRLSR